MRDVAAAGSSSSSSAPAAAVAVVNDFLFVKPDADRIKILLTPMTDSQVNKKAQEVIAKKAEQGSDDEQDLKPEEEQPAEEAAPATGGKKRRAPKAKAKRKPAKKAKTGAELSGDHELVLANRDRPWLEDVGIMLSNLADQLPGKGQAELEKLKPQLLATLLSFGL